MVNSIYQGNRMEELRLDKRGLSGLQLPLLAQLGRRARKGSGCLRRR